MINEFLDWAQEQAGGEYPAFLSVARRTAVY
jgi:hypothetical protein